VRAFLGWLGPLFLPFSGAGDLAAAPLFSGRPKERF